MNSRFEKKEENSEEVGYYEISGYITDESKINISNVLVEAYVDGQSIGKQIAYDASLNYKYLVPKVKLGSYLNFSLYSQSSGVYSGLSYSEIIVPLIIEEEV